MKILKNKKGMTLVEIIVALLIASILLVIMGSLILKSFDYFNETTDQSLNKQSLDSVASFTREQLLYTSDVRVDTKKPEGDNWKALYIKEGKLFHDNDMIEGNDEQLYSDQFYNHNKIVIKVTGIGKYRLDIGYEYVNSEGEKNYETSDTLELLNVKVKAEKDNDFDPLSNIRTAVNLEEQGYRIYYQQIFEYQEPPKPDDPTQGTVADQIACMNDMNNRGPFNSSTFYWIGDFVSVTVDGETVYYRCLNQGTYLENEVTGTNRLVWKKISAYHSVGSAYLVGDIVIDKSTGKYYECIQSTKNQGYAIALSNGMFWKSTGKPTGPNEFCNIPGILDEDRGTVGSKDDKLNISSLPPYSGGAGNAGEFITYEGNVWKKLTNGSGSTIPGTKDNHGDYVWQKIQAEWDSTSAYTSKDYTQGEYQDVVRFNGAYYRVNEKENKGSIVDGRPPAIPNANGNWVANNGWERVRRNAYGQWELDK